MDPADEFYSPYVYCHNDPVNFLDPDGADDESWVAPFVNAWNVIFNSKNENPNVNQVTSDRISTAAGWNLDGLKAKSQVSYFTAIEDDIVHCRPNDAMELQQDAGDLVYMSAFHTSNEARLTVAIAEAAASSSGASPKDSVFDQAVDFVADVISLFSTLNQPNTESVNNGKKP